MRGNLHARIATTRLGSPTLSPIASPICSSLLKGRKCLGLEVGKLDPGGGPSWETLEARGRLFDDDDDELPEQLLCEDGYWSHDGVDDGAGSFRREDGRGVVVEATEGQLVAANVSLLLRAFDL